MDDGPPILVCADLQFEYLAEGRSHAKLIVTDAANRPKLDEVPCCPPVLLADRGKGGSFAALLATQRQNFLPVLLRGDDW